MANLELKPCKECSYDTPWPSINDYYFCPICHPEKKKAVSVTLGIAAYAGPTEACKNAFKQVGNMAKKWNKENE